MTVHIEIPDSHPCELISQEDRQWFEDNPTRLFRLRFATDGDPGGAGHGCLVLVFCCTDGVSVRIPHSTNMTFARACELMDHGTDAELSGIFRQLIADLKRAEVHYVDGSTKAMRPLAEYQRRLFEACRKRGRRLTAEEFDRLSPTSASS